MHRPTARRLLRWLARALLLILAGSGMLLGYLHLRYGQDLEDAPRSSGPNAIWLRHQWVGEARPPEAYAALAGQLRQHGFTDAFFHVGPLDATGRIPPDRYAHAGALIQNLEAAFPALRIQAWVGQVEKRAGGPLDLDEPAVREAIVATAGSLLELGFEGIHYNIEPIYVDDRRFLEVLDRTRTLTRAAERVLSVSSDELEPFPGIELLFRPFFRQVGLWDRAYYREVAARVDQIAVMMYDTALPWEFLFGHLVAWQTRQLLAEVGDGVTLFMGVPSYEEPSRGHHPEAEHVRSGLRGIRMGLRGLEPARQARFGAALYAEWTTDGPEWEQWRTLWLPQKEGAR